MDYFLSLLPPLGQGALVTLKLFVITLALAVAFVAVQGQMTWSAVQLELAQCTYMEEFEPFNYREDLAAPTRVVLKQLLARIIEWGRER